jgi:hypothetical protein
MQQYAPVDFFFGTFFAAVIQVHHSICYAFPALHLFLYGFFFLFEFLVLMSLLCRPEQPLPESNLRS